MREGFAVEDLILEVAAQAFSASKKNKPTPIATALALWTAGIGIVFLCVGIDRYLENYQAPAPAALVTGGLALTAAAATFLTRVFRKKKQTEEKLPSRT